MGFKAQRKAAAGTGQAGTKLHRAAATGVARPASALAIVLGKAARHIGGNAAIQCAVCAFQKVHKPACFLLLGLWAGWA